MLAEAIEAGVDISISERFSCMSSSSESLHGKIGSFLAAAIGTKQHGGFQT